MTWIVGIDEAGYGPNLGPFLMTSVACRVPEACRDADLWQVLRAGVRRGAEVNDERLLIDDSKRVYTSRGLAGLERGVLPALTHRPAGLPATLAELVESVCPDDREELRREVWYRGVEKLPIHLSTDELEAGTTRFGEVCTASVVGDWQVRGVAICPMRFNTLLDAGGTKSHVLGHALITLLRWQRAHLPGEEEMVFLVDKHGGRNTYAAMIQHAWPDGIVLTQQESLARSVYRVHGLGREVHLVFQPRADDAHLCVALASMMSKYLREVLMLEFNRFWREHLSDLKPTAGYPSDAARFLQAIRPILDKLGLREESIWRRK